LSIAAFILLAVPLAFYVEVERFLAFSGCFAGLGQVAAAGASSGVPITFAATKGEAHRAAAGHGVVRIMSPSGTRHPALSAQRRVVGVAWRTSCPAFVLEAAAQSVGRIPTKTVDSGLVWAPLLPADTINESIIARATAKNPQGAKKLPGVGGNSNDARDRGGHR